MTQNNSELRVLHTADLHLDRSFGSWGDIASVRQRDLLLTLDRIGDLAQEKQVHLVLIAGDLFDLHEPSASTAQHVRGWLGRLDSAGIVVAIIPGNHDSYWYARSIYRNPGFPDSTVLFTEPTCEQPRSLELNGINVHLYGIAHDHTQEREPLTGYRRRPDDGVHIGMLHGTVDASPHFDVADRYLPLTSAGLGETGLDYVALGHIHRFRKYNAGRNGFACNPGSPEPLAIDETGERHVALIRFNGGPPQLEPLRVGLRLAQRQEIDCTGLDADQVIDRVRQHAGDTAIMEAILTGTPADLPDVDAIQSRLLSEFCYLVVRDRSSVVNASFVREIEGERTIRGRFVDALRKQIENAENERAREKAELALRIGLVALEQRSAQ